jgi:hypothetical protein
LKIRAITLCSQSSDQGALWIWGQNKFQGAILNPSDQTMPSEVTSFRPDKVIQATAGRAHNLMLVESIKFGRRLFAVGSHELGQCGVGGETSVEGSAVRNPTLIGLFETIDDPIVKIASGYDHNLVLTASGKV